MFIPSPSNSTLSPTGLWRSYRRVPASVLPRSWHKWVLDKGSLTKRLLQVANGSFEVRLVTNGRALPLLHERQALALGDRQQALVREVELCCFGEVWVQARSIIPFATLSGEERQLRYLGNKPLGAYLFQAATMRRERIEIAAFGDNAEQVFYGRRSCFRLHDKPLLVSEVFMPAILEADAAATQRYAYD